MKSKAEIYTTILKRALNYINGEQKQNLTNIIIKEYMDNHLHAEPLEFEFEDEDSSPDQAPSRRDAQRETSPARD